MKDSTHRENAATATIPNLNKSFNTINDIQTVMSIYTMNGKAKPMPLPKEYQPVVKYKGQNTSMRMNKPARQTQSISLVTSAPEDRSRHPILGSTQTKWKDQAENVLSPTGRASFQCNSTQRSSNQQNSQNITVTNNQMNNSLTQRSSMLDQKFSTLEQPSGPNVIDLEAQNLSNGQVKSIHNQIKRDCSLLRNRVRMLENEMLKANKKINETKKKTFDIKLIKKENDTKYLQKLEKQKVEQQASFRSKVFMEARLKQSNDMKEKRYQMFLSKRKEVEDYKREVYANKEAVRNLRIEM